MAPWGRIGERRDERGRRRGGEGSRARHGSRAGARRRGYRPLAGGHAPVERRLQGVGDHQVGQPAAEIGGKADDIPRARPPDGPSSRGRPRFRSGPPGTPGAVREGNHASPSAAVSVSRSSRSPCSPRTTRQRMPVPGAGMPAAGPGRSRRPTAGHSGPGRAPSVVVPRFADRQLWCRPMTGRREPLPAAGRHGHWDLFLRRQSRCSIKPLDPSGRWPECCTGS